MLLAIDVGNTQTVIGLFKGQDLLEDYRISTRRDYTADEYIVLFKDLFQLDGYDFKQIKALIISSVVPTCTRALDQMATEKMAKKAIIVGAGIKTGINILYDNPHEVGSDRIVNAVAALNLYGSPIIIVDFGTAITFDVVTGKGDYIGGAIAPGIEISAEALFERAARLSKVELISPRKAIGKNTQESLQSGIIFGTAGLIDFLITKIWNELDTATKVVATGGLAAQMARICQTNMTVDLLLTLKGLQIIYTLNSA